jgi:hypothetical protein
MADNEKAVRDAAAALKTAINEAVTAGYRIDWPSNAAGLDTIAISETAAVKRDAPKAAVLLDDSSL